jgi:hypothetical protein
VDPSAAELVPVVRDHPDRSAGVHGTVPPPGQPGGPAARSLRIAAFAPSSFGRGLSTPAAAPAWMSRGRVCHFDRK